jgi:hypothetical protein
VSAVLAHDQIDGVVADLELLKDIRRAREELRDAEFKADERVTLTISTTSGIKEQPVCFVHGGSEWLASVALRAMEREVLTRLSTKDISVEEPA